ncbi:thiamine biosynthesis protein ThiF [Virgibacillus phasianinus]|uniref:Thiamine biosynthesis protein ThiF n=1 Tax=Virgibacillus phasianinus TaxID=2017483 RepID=A0A220U5U1_9BACI|nr:ThiF family adenylyltransferase [Virgibacillus phasianinus]ASK63191.1 thiamine biosynthesis protein ThiF [Virgibacillus phasianinus]
MVSNRYSRQLLFHPIQHSGQEKLQKSSVLIVGLGALGTVICNHLVRAGVGRVRIIDRDYVELSNLQRQMLYDEEDVKEALPKAVAAKSKLKKINSSTVIDAIVGNVTAENIDPLLDGIDVVMDGTDNLSTRFILNDGCFKHQIPFSYGGVVSSRGMQAFFIPDKTPCLRCLIQESANDGQTCDTVGVIAPAVDMVSSLQVTETIKYLTGNEKVLRNTLRTFDIWVNNQYDINLSKPKKDCPTCQNREFPSLRRKAEDEETVLCGRNTVQIHQRKALDLKKWQKKLMPVASVKQTPFLLKAQFDDEISFVLFPDGRVLVQGTEDTITARSWYDRYIGS